MEPFKDTVNIDAHFYLDDSGDEITREKFIQNMHEWGNDAFMLYVGGGYCPLRVAICAYNVSDAYCTFTEWARNNDRLDEIGEDDPEDEYFGEYESTHQVITQDMIKPFLEMEYGSAHEWLNHWLNTIDDIKHLRHVAITMGTHLDADTIQDDFERAMDEMGYFTPNIKPILEA